MRNQTISIKFDLRCKAFKQFKMIFGPPAILNSCLLILFRFTSLLHSVCVNMNSEDVNFPLSLYEHEVGMLS
jgi:hypothetical protein